MTEPIKHEIDDTTGVLVNSIILRRIYDVLSVMLASIDPAGFEEVMKLHEAGLFVTPEISYTVVPDAALDED